MPLDHDQVIEFVKDAETSTSVTREEASQMLVFGRVSQWENDVSDDVTTMFRGQFDIIKPKRNRILAELWANPVGITFKPKDGADKESAEILTGMWRADMIRSEEAYEAATQDMLDCGFGALRLVTEYESKFDSLNNNQRIKAIPINEANNVVYFDSNAKRKDKSDAKMGVIVTTYTKKGWEEYCSENGIEYNENDMPSFRGKKRSNMFIWSGKQDEVKIGEVYYKEKKREKIILFQDPMGQLISVYKSEVKQVLDELIDLGYQKVGTRTKDRWIVYKCLDDGNQIIPGTKKRVPGEHIPIIPFYGDWSRVEGREIWRGIYHDAQDSQMLHNWNLSYMGDLVAKGPSEKPIFYDGQIQGKEFYWTQSGASDNFPYRLVNEKNANGEPYPPGPIEYSRPPQIPQASAALLELTRRSVDDVTGGTLDAQQMLSGQVTEGQIAAVKNSQNMEHFLYQNSSALAMKHCATVYASMAAELYDVPRNVTITLPDGTEKEAQIMMSVYDEQTGDTVVINDITTGTFEAYAKTGPSFQTQKDEARSEMRDMYESLAGTPEGNMILLTYLTLIDGPNTDHIQEYARKQLILQGLMKPETEEELVMLQQAMQQQNKPDPMEMVAQAEMLNARTDAQSKTAKAQIDAYNAETRRYEAATKAKEAGFRNAKVETEITGTELDNIQKLQNAMLPPGMRLS